MSVQDSDASQLGQNEVLVSPTKALFVEMLTRDLPLDLAVTDLVDNSVDGARRLRPGDDESLEGLHIILSIGGEKFSIEDNCGGIPIDLAQTKAFRFGRTRDAAPTPHSVGQFGVGMKRALFKFGRLFTVSSISKDSKFELTVDVDEWEDENTPWVFKFSSAERNLQIPADQTGTTILVKRLRTDAVNNFSRADFINNLMRTIQEAQQQYLGRGLMIICNGIHLSTIPWTVLQGPSLTPAFIDETITTNDHPQIRIRVCVGINESNPGQAGWYISCNGRIVLSADQTDRTGWSQTTETSKVPQYHNQFSRFRGYTFFDSEDASQLPWNTTKDDIDIDSAVYQHAMRKMVTMMRPVIDFLNALDAEDRDAGVGTPLSDAIEKAKPVAVRDVRNTSAFAAPPRAAAPPLAHIAYSKERSKVIALQAALSAASNKQVGIKTFDLAYQQFVGEE